MRLSVYIRGIGVLGPGITDWREAAAVLAGRSPYAAAPMVLQTPAILPSAERRRTGPVVKLAIGVAAQAVAHAGLDPATLASVFTSSGGDGQNCHELCAALAVEHPEISPTKFANSVHNAAAGYWSIATGAKLESNVLCAFDASFCAGLLEAMVQVVVQGASLLLVAYDTQYPEPIHAKRPLPAPFGAALVLTPERDSGSLARIEAMLGDGPADRLADPALEALRGSIPAARCLPLLRRLALEQAGRVVLDYLDDSRVVVQVEPCV